MTAARVDGLWHLEEHLDLRGPRRARKRFKAAMRIRMVPAYSEANGMKPGITRMSLKTAVGYCFPRMAKKRQLRSS
jgi:hypothetical protein